ncbi:hypothetical protein C900_03177 [Fulvivirga imtechensis AK7]|uniref:Lcl C-terminal domain-containing protein n=1 Tax=Fulvivirga imtechensis AK7 TaxID=1237149 RepID=L8JUT2_9BACT|nr:DUF1566 domain-containing protein [Fulvivirga imtechensis]ELR71047.1 hypothetical protein C900_03177 [Fulvivirga imtechensis AK7]
MNRLTAILLVFICITSFEVVAQSPASFRYQAALQGAGGEPLANKKVSFIVTILRSATDKQRVFAEFHIANTDEFGMVSLQIGKGNPVFKNFRDINWGSGDHFLKIEIDETGGTQFKLLNEVQLLSVPYAIHARTADNVDDADADPTNELQTLSIEEQQLTISNGNTITLPLDNDSQTLSIDGNQLSISNGNTVTLPSAGGHLPDPTQPVAIRFRGKSIYVYPTDNASGIIFAPFGDTAADSDHDGAANTAALIQAHGDGNYAAKLCDDLNAYGYDDWYLPSRAELDAVFKQNYLISDYSLEAYWTSTELTTNMAWGISFSTGTPNETTKNQARRCRCIRSE